MNPEELIARWQSPEDELTEWKPSLSQTESIYRTICAFANDYAGHAQPGIVFIGREDDGRCSHLALDDATLRDFVGNIRNSGSILPLPKVSYQQVTLEDCPVLALIIAPSHSTPVQFGGTVYIRQGPTTRKARPDEISTLTQKRFHPSFDARAANSATPEDLDLSYLETEYIPSAVSYETLQDNGRSLNEQLAALRILTPQYQPTHLGLLIAGRDPRRFLPGAYIQFRRIDGTELADPTRDHQEISGRLSDVLRLTYDKLRAHIEITTHTDLATGRRSEHPTYPFEALRELVANAVVHRNYETSSAPIRITWFRDRIEIHNPGGPYGLVTEQNFGQPHVTDYRNPELAAALKSLGYIERFGSGIAKVRRLLEANGNPEVFFEPRKNDNYVLATVGIA